VREMSRGVTMIWLSDVAASVERGMPSQPTSGESSQGGATPSSPGEVARILEMKRPLL